MNNIEETFRINLKKYLKEQRKTQKDLAEYLEVSPAIVSYYIKGINTPRMDKIDKISEFFGIERSDLIGHKMCIRDRAKPPHILHVKQSRFNACCLASFHSLLR